VSAEIYVLTLGHKRQTDMNFVVDIIFRF